MSRRLCWHPARVRMLRVTSWLASAAQQEILTASPPSCFEKEVVSHSHSFSCPSFLSFPAAAGQGETYFNAWSHRCGWRLLRTIRPIREQLLTPKKHDHFFHSFALFSEQVKVAGGGATKRKSVQEWGRRERESEGEREKAADSGREIASRRERERMVIVQACATATAERKEVWNPWGSEGCHVRWATDLGQER